MSEYIKYINRIGIELKSDSDNPLSGWQFQELISNLNKGYSKLDLVNEISRLLNKGVSPENIIIMNKSYEINNKYKYLRGTGEIDLNKADKVKCFYHLGRPISMYPNDYIKMIEIIFKLYDKSYTLFKKHKIENVSKKNLIKYIDKKQEFDKIIDQFQKDLMKNIDLEVEDKAEAEAIKNTINTYIDNSKQQYKLYSEDITSIKKFEDIKDKEFLELSEDNRKLFSEMEKKYYNEFFKKFKKLDRPIILQYDNYSNKLSVIRKEYMLNDIESDNFLDYKSYSHNSPFIINLIGGSCISLIFALFYKSIGQAKKNVDKKKEYEIQHKFNQEELQQIIYDLSQTSMLNEVKEVKDSFLNMKLSEVNEYGKKNVKTTLNRSGIKKDGVIIDFFEYKRNSCKHIEDSGKEQN